MADMLVKLYQLPPLQPALDAIRPHRIAIRPARVGEEHQISPWIAHHFAPGWAQGVSQERAVLAASAACQRLLT